MTAPREVEYALLVDWGDEIEFVPAKSVEHANRMAATLYVTRPSWTVGREIPPWRFIRQADHVLTDQEVAIDRPVVAP